MYSVYGGVQHHRSRIKHVVVAALLLMAVIMTLAWSAQVAHAKSASAKSATLQKHSVQSSAKKLADPAFVSLAPAGSDRPQQVTRALTDAIGHESSGTWSVAVYDIANQQWLARINADQQMTSASLYKLYAVYALSKAIPPSQWSAQSANNQSLASCVDRMLRLSDNSCGEAVSSMIGWGTIDRYAHAAGFTKTFTNIPTTGPITTAADTTSFMTSLYQSKLFDVSTTSVLLDSLHHQLYRKGIPVGCPGCTVYNKTGNDGTVNHDSAIVTSGDSVYAVTIMSQNGSSAGIARIEQALELAMHN